MTPLGASAPRPPKLGRYELITRIGHGGMAEVQLALQRGPAGFEKLVVVKLVHENLATQKAFVDMLLDEARMAALVKHPNVVDIYELGEDAGRYFIAMEYLEGEPLLAVLRAGRDGRRLDVLSTARLVADTAEGLDAAHELRSLAGDPIELVHHDVSLGNIVVLYNGQVKLVDFGVAKASQSTTAPTRIQGKFSYMAPEKLRGGAGDRRSDIWSLGCVLWEALTLRRLFKGANDSETMHQVLEGAILAPSQVNGDVPADFDAICLRALHRDQDHRYASAKAMASDLEDVLRKHGYAAKNDQIARYMQATFETHIAARKKLLQEVSSKGRASPDLVDAAFHEGAAQGTPAPDLRTAEIKRSDIEASRVRATGTDEVAPQVRPPIVPALARMPAPPVIADALPKLLPPEPTALEETIVSTTVGTTEGALADAAETQAELRRVDLALGTSEHALVAPAAGEPGDIDGATVADGMAFLASEPVAIAIEPVATQPSLAGDTWRDPGNAAPSRMHVGIAASPPSTFVPMRRFELPNVVPLVARPMPPAVASPPAARSGPDSGVIPPVVAVEIQHAPPVATAHPPVIGEAGESDARPAPNKRWMIYPAAAAAILAVIVVTSMTMGHRAPATQAAAVAAPSPLAVVEPPVVEPPAVQPPAPPPPADVPAPVATHPTPPADPTPAPAHAVEDPPVVPQTPTSPPPSSNNDGSRRNANRHGSPGTAARPPAEKLNPGEVFKAGLQAWVRGDTRTALAAYKRVIAANPEYAPAWRGVGLVYEKLGDKPAAHNAFQKYLRLAPDAPDVGGIRARLEAP